MNTAREETTRLADLLRREHHAMADFLVALAEFDAARRWEELGYKSLFSFLVRELGLSKGAAFYRNRAAELVRKVPQVIEPLRDGRLCLSSVAELASVLTPENVADVLPRFFHLSRSGAKEVTAELRPDPAPALRTVVTAVPPATAPAFLPVQGGFLENLGHANSVVPDEVRPAVETVSARTVARDRAHAAGAGGHVHDHDHGSGRGCGPAGDLRQPSPEALPPRPRRGLAGGLGA